MTLDPTPTPGLDSVLALLPESASVTPAGRLAIGGVDLADVAAEFGTPAYVVDVAGLRHQARRLVDGLAQRWPNSEVLFASKSFPAVALYRLAAEEGLSIDVAGAGEIVMALAAGVDPSRLYFHGNAKTDAELSQAVDARVGTIMVDNFDELDRLQRLVTRTEAGIQDVMVRVIPGVAPDTHPSQSTGGHDSKFGLPFDQAIEAMERIKRCERLRLAGVHLHIGSQVLAAEPFAQAVREVSRLGDLPAYDVGGGLGVRYTYAETPPTVDEYLDAIVGAARAALPANAKLLIEPGRSLVARAGISLYRVVSVKHTGRTFVAVDGGMADNMDIALTAQRYEAAVVDRVSAQANVRCDVVGRHCESGDRLIEGIDLPDPVVGDLLVVAATGAYAYTMANNYNGALRPPVVFVENGVAREVVRRETFADLLSLQVLPDQQP
jgi:diaminopimelate decarboxylase